MGRALNSLPTLPTLMVCKPSAHPLSKIFRKIIPRVALNHPKVDQRSGEIIDGLHTSPNAGGRKKKKKKKHFDTSGRWRFD